MRHNDTLRKNGIGLLLTLTAGVLTAFALAGSVHAAYPSSGAEVPAGSQFLEGTVIGEANGWDGSPGTGAAAAFDGNGYSYYDPTAQGQDHTYCGMDFGTPMVLTKVMILPRDGWLDRFDGGSIQGSNDMEDWETVFASSSPASGWDWQEIEDFDSNSAFRYFRYWNGKNHGDVAEIEFYGRAPGGEAPAGPVLLTGEVIGEEYGWSGSPETGAASAFDGDKHSYYDPTAKAAEYAYAGLDLGAQYFLSKVRILPREGWTDRFRGGSIQGSNNKEDWETLYTSPSAAATWDWQTITEFDANTGYRYYRYWNGDEHGDVAEIQLYGYPLDGSYTPPTPGTLAVPAGEITVTFDIRRDTIDSDAQPITVQPGGTYPALPGSPVSSFVGWYTLAEGGEQVKEGDPVTRLASHTLYARYESDLTANPAPVSAEQPSDVAPADSETPETAAAAETPAAEEPSGIRPLPIVCIAVCAVSVAVTGVVMSKRKD